MDRDYQAIVIGAGLGGLSSALTLAQAGIKTLLIEQHNIPGGCATSFKRGRFEFEGSLHEFCGYGKPGHLGYAGRLVEEIYDVHPDIRPCQDLFRAIFTSRSGKYIDITLPIGEQEIIDAMDKAIPGSREGMEKFISLCREASEVSNYFDAHMFDKKKANGEVKISKSYFMKHFFRYLQVAEEPFNEVCRKIGLPEDAIDVLDCYKVYLGVDPDEVSFAHLATMIYSYIAFGPVIIAPNSHALSLQLLEKFQSHGGTAYFNVKALKVEADKKGKIYGVMTDQGLFRCEEVIANVYPTTAYNHLLSENVKIPKREKRKAAAFKVSSRFVNIYLGLNKSFQELGIDEYTLFYPGDMREKHTQSKDPTDYLLSAATAYNLVYPEISPKGTGILTLTLAYEDDIWGEIDPKDYFKCKEELAKKAIKHYEEVRGISISPYIEEIEVATPWTFARFLATPQGGVYGIKMNKWNTILTALLGIRRDQPIDGFKTTGASGARGDGYSQSLWSGRDIGLLALEEIKARRKKRG